ncbi:uncharacterized protein ACNS7B_010395 [Menidia menidia]
MSAVWLKTSTILCLCYAALTETVVWRHVGEDVTIQCRGEAKYESLSLKRGLSQDVTLFHRAKTNRKTLAKEIEKRSQTNGEFPNMDILIKNLTSNDTGPYWCIYKIVDASTSTLRDNKGKGSVLLVVTENKGGKLPADEDCDQSHQSLVVVSSVISGAVLLGIILAFLIWIILKTRTSCFRPKRRQVATNDVYEDMRGRQRMLN